MGDYMYYVYKIELKNGEVYIGCTNNIKRRRNQHNENIRLKKSKLGKYISENYNNLILQNKDLQIQASFIDRKQALTYEKKLTVSYIGKCKYLLNDNYNIDCSRKGKNIGNTSKNYILIDIQEKKEIKIYDLRQYCINNNLDYKLIQRTVKGNKLSYNRYKVFYEYEWIDIKNKDYYITGEFYKNYLEKLKQNRKCKKYLVKLPSGEIKEVINLDKFARENNLTSGTLHATYIKKKKTKGYQVIKRM